MEWADPFNESPFRVKGGEGQASKQRPNSRKGNAKAVARYSTRFLASFAGSFEPTKEPLVYIPIYWSQWNDLSSTSIYLK